MTPHISRAKEGWGTFMVDRRWRGVGRVRVASGTKDLAEFQRIDAFLTTCYPGRLDLLIGLTGGRKRRLYTLPELWTAFQTMGLDRLPTADTLQHFEAAARKWVKSLPDGEHTRKAGLTVNRLHLLDLEGRVYDLPRLLRLDRDRSAERAVAFNRERSHMSAFVRDTLGIDHPLYKALRAIRPLKVERKSGRRGGRPLEPAELELVVSALGGGYGEAARSMAETGMGPKEFWSDGFLVLPDRVLILGEKRPGRERFVPRLGQVPPPRVTRSAFEQRLKRVMATDKKRKERKLPEVKPYDFRRSYAHWLEMAQIPRTRRRLYRGHGPADVGDLYEEHEVEKFLAEDAEKMLAYLGRARKLGMRLA